MLIRLLFDFVDTRSSTLTAQSLALPGSPTKPMKKCHPCLNWSSSHHFVILFVSPQRAEGNRSQGVWTTTMNNTIQSWSDTMNSTRIFKISTRPGLFSRTFESFWGKYPAVIPQVFNYLTNEPLFSENPAVVEELNGALIELQRPDLSECPTCRVCIHHKTFLVSMLILLANDKLGWKYDWSNFLRILTIHSWAG